jgi:hypothetical protein
MELIIRAINLICAPVLAFWFNDRFEKVPAKWKRVAATAATGIIVLGVELALRQGPRHIAYLRSWLDDRAAFEGLWIQEVVEAQKGNDVAVFSITHEPEADTFTVHGNAYSSNGAPFARWRSTRVFFDTRARQMEYLWEGEQLDVRPTPDVDKSGRTQLELHTVAALSLPVNGEGRVWHIGEGIRVRFRMRRVTNELLSDLRLPFTVKDAQLNAHDEEVKLVRALVARLHAPSPRPADRRATVGH